MKNSFPWKRSTQSWIFSPTRFLNQIKSGKFAKKIDWISDELFPEKNQQEKEPDKLEEIKSQLEKDEIPAGKKDGRNENFSLKERWKE